MAFAATISTTEPRANSIGVMKCEVYTYTAVSGDTTGTITSKNLNKVFHVLIDGISYTAAPTFSANAATLAFTDPGANIFGTVLLFGY